MEYWASKAPDEFLDEAHQRIEDFYTDLQDTKLFYVWERSFRAYYGANLTENSSGRLFDSSELTRSGQQGEITNLKLNHYRNLLQHTIQLATQEKPAWTCRSINTDYKSQAQCILGRGLLDYYFREKHFHKHYRQMVENALVFSEGWIHFPWNPAIGEVFISESEDGPAQREGDIEFSTHSPLDVIRDVNLKNDDEHEWLTVRNFHNKFNLAEKYPGFASEILDEDESLSREYENFDSFEVHVRQKTQNNSDRIPVWTFYHKATEALPQGRTVIFISGAVLFDGEFNYDAIPLQSVMPENLISTPYGYSPGFDLLAPQQALDILGSTIMTNQATNGVQNLWTQKGDEISIQELGGGVKHISSEVKPEGLQLTKTAPETYNFMHDVIGQMETLSGISATVRGNPEASLKSGAALALVVSQSIQFASILEQSINNMLEAFGTDLLNILKRYAKTKRTATIMGVNSRSHQKEFTDEDIADINRVVVERASPLSKTTAGRIQLADSLLERGLIQDADKYLMVLNTGQIEPATEDRVNQELNVREENESLRNGENVSVILTENHAMHIREHSAIIGSPEAKQDPEFIKRVLQHIQKHLDEWKALPPELAMVTGQEVLPQAQPAGPSGPPSGPATPSGPVEPIGAQLPTMPEMPTNPLTGNKFNNEDGGL